MSLYDEILAAQADLKKLRKSRIFMSKEEATRYAEKHGMVVKELPAPQEPDAPDAPDAPGTPEEPGEDPSTPTATMTKTAAWAAVPRDQESLQEQESHNQKVTQHAKDAGVIHLMRQIKNKREDLNHARADLGNASNGETDIFVATASLASAKQDLTQAEESLIQRWNAAIARANKQNRPKP